MEFYKTNTFLKLLLGEYFKKYSFFNMNLILSKMLYKLAVNPR